MTPPINLSGDVQVDDACFGGNAGGRKAKDLREFNWLNTVMGNLKASLGKGLPCLLFLKVRDTLLSRF